MYVILAFATWATKAAVVLGLVAWKAEKLRSASALAASLGLPGIVSIALGLLGRAQGLSLPGTALHRPLSPAYHAELLRVAEGEAAVPLAFGFLVVLLPLLSACVAYGSVLALKGDSSVGAATLLLCWA